MIKTEKTAAAFPRSKSGQMHLRKSTGSTIDLVCTLSVLFLLLFLPLLDLAVVCMKVTFVHSAARNAARVAGRAHSFNEPVDKNPAALGIARDIVEATRSGSLSGVEITSSDVKVSIVGSPLDTSVPPIYQSQPLKEVDAKKYLYQVEVEVKGRVTPLVTLSKSIFGSVPGLTEPIPVLACYREMAEHPSGLAK